MASISTAKRSSETKEFPNWLEMPDELMAKILQRLGTVEILKSSRKDILKTLTKKAVDLSCGELIDISILGFGNDELLDHIVLRQWVD
ncbi:unnamed protein product [Lactuca virosa]|uniref:F-box domain-containing protein n=1 Tax=Lactuca virosa TaxID=75947 RepID=A0AAU9PEN7_9ASTR|nr:unnamed protein product [Lactuca virosa]